MSGTKPRRRPRKKRKEINKKKVANSRTVGDPKLLAYDCVA